MRRCFGESFFTLFMARNIIDVDLVVLFDAVGWAIRSAVTNCYLILSGPRPRTRLRYHFEALKVDALDGGIHAAVLRQFELASTSLTLLFGSVLF